VKALAERRSDGVRFPTILIDGVEYAGETMIVALGITEGGTKRVLGLRQGATENAAVCIARLEDLQERGLDTSQPTLLVLDGAKALNAAMKRVSGQSALIQRCQVHKKRSVKAHVPGKHHAELERRLATADQETNYETAERSNKGTAAWLGRISPDAAAILCEGLEETLTVVSLGLVGALRRTLATTDPIESALSVTRRVPARLTRWRDGDMRQRCCVAGLLRAESQFRRIKGHRAMHLLIKALEVCTREQPPGSERDVA
jgi:transposase-like protein